MPSHAYRTIISHPMRNNQLSRRNSHHRKRRHEPVFKLEKRSPSGIRVWSAHIIVRYRRDLLPAIRVSIKRTNAEQGETHHGSTESFR